MNAHSFLVVLAPLTLLASPPGAFAQTPANSSAMPGVTAQVCFTPGEDCEGLVVETIERASRQILVQAYSFTSPGIAKALVQAHQRGVDVRVILDKSQRSERYSGATFLKNEGIPVVIDEKPAIAHSKVMILDGASVITGSFNFTRSAQERNAENLLVLTGSAALVQRYTRNWANRFGVSVPY